MHPSRLFSLALILSTAARAGAAPEPVRFGQDVLPILSAKCFACHGPDDHERKAKLRLDTPEGVRAALDDGVPVVPGQPEKSTLIARVTHADPDEVMPPPESNKKVTPAEADILRRWIAEGAPWGKHWSFEPVTRPTPPGPGQPVDAFINARLTEAGLRPQPPADAHTLVRRLALDLTGLPPSPERADAFAAKPTEENYRALVDELLASPAFGEHWARMWLDIARYADTKGYEKDRGRTVWPYRDWVIDAFNRDLPLDKFTEEQLAGDLLPGGSVVATAFHRNTMSNDEGGTDDEEFRTVAVKDRVDTTVQAWMGVTMGCAKCHTHKYDPVSIDEYYSLYAIFNQTEDADRADDAPLHAVVDPAREAERARLREALAQSERLLQDAEGTALRATGGVWRLALPSAPVSKEGATLTVQSDGSVLASGKLPERDEYALTLTLAPGIHRGIRLEALTSPQPDGRATVGRRADDANFVVSEFILGRVTGDTVSPVPVKPVRANYEQKGWPVSGAADGKRETGWAVSNKFEEPHAAVFAFDPPMELTEPVEFRLRLLQEYGDRLVLHRPRLSTTADDPAKAPLQPKLPGTEAAHQTVAEARKSLKRASEETPRVPVMRELAAGKQRVTKLHQRGSFLDPGKEVQPGVPTAFGALPAGASTNRLGVAKWLLAPENPLTARVWANRIWARLFGTGIVETEEDFGALGTAPSHPELLDWLAVEYREGGWSLKKLLRVIVLSETYRRSSASTAALREADPRNRLLARAPRTRLTAEMVRDQALAVSGLLSAKMGGPPVMPPQPAGLWRSTYSGEKWVDAEGADRWRRGLYTFIKRTTPHPALITFDAGSREVCLIRRIQTNTPLQALVTMNDPAMLEAAAALAARVAGDSGGDEARAARALRQAVVRPVNLKETEPLLRLLRDSRARFQADPATAADLVRTGRQAVPAGLKEPEFAAWLIVANAVLNLDETLTRP